MNLAILPVSVMRCTAITPRMSNQESNKTRKLFAERLRASRRDAGYKTARKFAAALEIDENRYTRYERAEVEPDLGLIARFCEFLNVTPNRLFGFEAEHTAAYATNGSAGPVPTGHLSQAAPANAMPGFSESRQQPIAEEARSLAGSGAAQQKLDTWTKAFRLAAWRLADARARARDAEADPVARLRLTAVLFDEVLADPIGIVANLARSGEMDRASAEYRREMASAADALIKQLTQSRPPHHRATLDPSS